jgi:hypothetical protein
VELETRLTHLDPDAIAAFQAHFDHEHARAYTVLLWGAAYIIGRGCSDDGFIDFRYGLIARGRSIFETALLDPDSLAEVTCITNEYGTTGYIPNESFGYVSGRVYTARTGLEISLHIQEPLHPIGEDWDFDDEELCACQLPKLWQRFGC